MSKKTINRVFGILVAALLIISNLQTASAQTKGGTGSGGNPVQTDAQNVSTNIQRPVNKTAIDPNKTVRVIVQLSDPASASYTGGVNGYQPTSPKAVGGKTLDVSAPSVVSYEKYLRGKQTEFVNSLSSAIPGAKTQRSYQTVLNAVVVQLPAGKVAALKQLPGVVKVSYEQERQLQMDSSLPLVGLGTGTVGGAWTDAGLWETLGGHQNAGKGIKIADIDSGITPSNPCFAPTGFTMPVGFPKGETAVTNAKIIVARSYFRASDPPFYPATAVDDPAVAEGGHGTHTAGTIACNYGTTTTFSGIEISGVAPAAQLMVYRVFYESITGSHSAWTPELVAAIEDAVRDGAQVVNNSWGGTNLNTSADDLETVAYEGAVDAGVVVIFSAGNSGPNTFTMSSPGGNSEKFITVAASTTARTFTIGLENTARSDSGTLLTPAIVGRSVSQTSVEAPVVDLETAGYSDSLACDPLPSGYATGKIVIIRRGVCALVDKVSNVKAAGAIGAVIRNVAGGSTTLPLIQPVLPTVHIAQADGDALVSFLAGLPTGATATFRINGPATVDPTGDVEDTLASFSSIGPNPDLALKPDISAPGVNILSSVSALEFGSTAESFDFYQGTSMAAPHVTGAAALMRQVHPDWTPAQIRSALMTSAAEPAALGANPTFRGAGRLDLTQPDKVALTFDHPSLSFKLAQIGVAKSITVTAQNTTYADVTYDMSVTANAAATVVTKVDGNVATLLTVPARGLKSFTVELTGVSADPAYGKVSFSLPQLNNAQAAPAALLHLPYYARVTAASTLNDVYLVDGDTSPYCTDYSQVYKDALTAANITYDYTEIDPDTYAGFDFYQARLHKWVLYFDGDPGCSGWLSYPYAESLRNYMAQGGKLLVMGQDVAFLDAYNNFKYGDTFIPEIFLGASYLQDNLFNGAVDLHAAGDSNYSPFVGGLVLPLDPATTTSVDEVAASMYTDTDMVPLFVNKDAPAAIGGSYAGVIGTRASSEPTLERVRTGKDWTKLSYRSLFTAFGLENILEGTKTTYRVDLLTKAQEWFMDDVQVLFPPTTMRTTDLRVAVPIAALGVSSEGGQILQMRVDYGDGSPIDTFSGDTVSIGHKYSAWGNYKVTVEATDEYGHKVVTSAPVQVGSVYYFPLIGDHN